MSTKTAADALAQATAAKTTPELVKVARALEAKTWNGRTQDERAVLTAVYIELEHRGGRLVDDVRFTNYLDDGHSYLDALLFVFPHLEK